MKITVDLSDDELRKVIRYSGERKKGPAIRKFIVQELLFKRRKEISRKVLAGDLKAEIPGFERLRKDRNVWRR
jgi:hypothetical protein